MASKGSAIVNQIERYINRYVSFPEWLPGQSLVMALWALHTWVFEYFPATPYLLITGSQPGAGKTTLLETLELVSQNPEHVSTLRPLALLRAIKDWGDRGEKCSIFVDESEKLASAAIGDLRSIFTSGYVAGGSHMITVKLTERMSFTTYCPKAFAQLGGVVDVVESRAIISPLVKASAERKPVAVFRVEKIKGIPQGMAAELVTAIRAYIKDATDVPLVVPEHLEGREAEIWTAIYSTAALFQLDKATTDRLVAACQDMIDYKLMPRKVHQIEGDVEKENAVRALRDLASVMPEPSDKLSGDLSSTEAIARMKAIAAAPWRSFRGEGLTADALATMLARFNVTTKKLIREGRGRDAKLYRGYRGADVRAAVAKYLKG